MPQTTNTTNTNLTAGRSPVINGLSTSEIPLLQEKYGRNEYASQKRPGFLRLLLNQIKEPMVLLLITSACLYFLIGQFYEGFLMLGAIILVSAVGLFQEWRSGKAIDALKEMISPTVIVFRDQVRGEIDIRELVPGDVIVLEEGNKIPADVLILEAHDLTVNEAVLTGESIPVYKGAGDEDKRLYQGTLINSGSCIAKVTTTGEHTELVKIGRMAAANNGDKTLLQLQLLSLTRKLAFAGVAAFAIIFVVNYIHYEQFTVSLLFALTLAMSVIPEEIPVAFTSFMALGGYRLSKNGIITRNTQIIENLGSMDIICLDKTGTITENKMSVHSVYDYAHHTLIDRNEEFANAADVLLYGALACEAKPFDAMEKAIKQAYEELKHTPGLTEYQIIHEYPLGGTPPMMTHVYSHNGQIIAAAKGAPEKIINICRIDEIQRQTLLTHIRDLSKQGLRILGIASAAHDGAMPQEQEDFNWQFSGLLALYDPPKKNIGDVISRFYSSGIDIKLVTGDYPDTAMSIARQIGMRNPSGFHTGEEVMRMSDKDLKEVAASTSIFARMFPEAKMRLIKNLRENGHIVAMTGDGVNDAPALKMAGIGIAMGKQGTEMAQQAADLVITDDNLEKINFAVTEGRRIYQNIRKAVRYIISIHLPIILVASMPVLLGWKFPNIFSPIHIIFLEIIMGPTCSIFFEKEPAETNTMPAGAGRKGTPLLRRNEWLLSCVMGLVIATGLLLLYYYYMHAGRSIEETRTAVFTALLLSNIFLTFSVRSYTATIFKTIRYKNSLALPVLIISVIFLFLILLYPPIRSVFGLVGIDRTTLISCILTAAMSTGWFEVYKMILPADSGKNIRHKD